MSQPRVSVESVTSGSIAERKASRQTMRRLRVALGAGREHVVLAERLELRGAHDEGERAEEHERHAGRRQEHVLEAVDERGREAGVEEVGVAHAAGRQPARRATTSSSRPSHCTGSE